MPDFLTSRHLSLPLISVPCWIRAGRRRTAWTPWARWRCGWGGGPGRTGLHRRPGLLQCMNSTTSLTWVNEKLTKVQVAGDARLVQPGAHHLLSSLVTALLAWLVWRGLKAKVHEALQGRCLTPAARGGGRAAVEAVEEMPNRMRRSGSPLRPAMPCVPARQALRGDADRPAVQGHGGWDVRAPPPRPAPPRPRSAESAPPIEGGDPAAAGRETSPLSVTAAPSRTDRIRSSYASGIAPVHGWWAEPSPGC